MFQGTRGRWSSYRIRVWGEPKGVIKSVGVVLINGVPELSLS